jgi:hypothetical protein
MKNINFQILEIDTSLPLSVKFISETVKDTESVDKLPKALNTIHWGGGEKHQIKLGEKLEARWSEPVLLTCHFVLRKLP